VIDTLTSRGRVASADPNGLQNVFKDLYIKVEANRAVDKLKVSFSLIGAYTDSTLSSQDIVNENYFSSSSSQDEVNQSNQALSEDAFEEIRKNFVDRMSVVGSTLIVKSSGLKANTIYLIQITTISGEESYIEKIKVPVLSLQSRFRSFDDLQIDDQNIVVPFSVIGGTDQIVATYNYLASTVISDNAADAAGKRAWIFSIELFPAFVAANENQWNHKISSDNAMDTLSIPAPLVFRNLTVIARFSIKYTSDGSNFVRERKIIVMPSPVPSSTSDLPLYTGFKSDVTSG